MIRALSSLLIFTLVLTSLPIPNTIAAEKPRIEPQIPENFEKTSIQYRCARSKPTQIIVTLYFDEREKWVIVLVQRRGRESLLTVSYPKDDVIYYFFRILEQWKPMSQITGAEMKKLREDGLSLEPEDVGFTDQCAKSVDIDGLL